VTRKDYQLIAAAIRDARRAVRDKEPAELQRDLLDGIDYAVDYLAADLERDSPRFDSQKFMAACGLEEG
jgi:hypothetical protein